MPGAIRPTVVTVDLEALHRNVAVLRRRGRDLPVCGVVKADAYGHGAVVVAKELERINCAMLAVTLVEEGVVLREAGIDLPIVVLGGAFGDDTGFDTIVRSRLTPVVWHRGQLEKLARAARTCQVDYHFKIDTGMARLGTTHIGEFLTEAKRHPSLNLDGLMTHFANADVVGDEKNHVQIEKFAEGWEQVKAAGFHPRWRHIANTPSILTDVHGSIDTLLRPGGGLYGLDTRDQRDEARLESVLTWTTKPVYVKAVTAGTTVSYGARWQAQRDSIIATLPVGYADGYPRALTAKAHTLIRGLRAPVIGTVCMDMCLIDVTDIPNVSTEDEVVLIGKQGNDKITADDLGAWTGTISYEITCGIGARVPRRYVGSQETLREPPKSARQQQSMQGRT
ncbi:MAG: alanine racemase [Clostridia bacterium]|nr:alanine racemase [Deltaproteobacteria bacterium]